MTALDEALAARNELHASDAWKLYGKKPTTHTALCGKHLDACIAALQPAPVQHGARSLPQGTLKKQATPLSYRASAQPTSFSSIEIDAPGPRGDGLLIMGTFGGPTAPPPPSPGPFTLTDILVTLAGAAVSASDPTSGTDQAGGWLGVQTNGKRILAAGPWSGFETCCQARDGLIEDLTIGWPQPDGTLKPVARTGLYIEHFTRRWIFDGLTVFSTSNSVNGEWTYADAMYASWTAKEYPAFPAGKSGSLDIEIRNFHLHSTQGWATFLDAGCCGYYIHDGLITGLNGIAHPTNLAIPSKPNRIDWATIDWRGTGQKELIHDNRIGGAAPVGLVAEDLAPGTIRNERTVYERIAA